MTQIQVTDTRELIVDRYKKCINIVISKLDITFELSTNSITKYLNNINYHVNNNYYYAYYMNTLTICKTQIISDNTVTKMCYYIRSKLNYEYSLMNIYAIKIILKYYKFTDKIYKDNGIYPYLYPYKKKQFNLLTYYKIYNYI